MSLLTISNLKYSYQSKSRLVLDIPKLVIPAEKKVFLCGPSGSGKSTLLGIMTGILAPQSGTVEVNNQNIFQMSSAQRDRWRGDEVGYIFQMFNLLPYLTVEQNIALPCQISKKRRDHLGGASLSSTIHDLANRLGIGSLLHHRATELSVGQQQRVAAARALIGRPRLIIADEPTSALAQDQARDFMHLLFAQAKRNGSSVIFVSHDQSLKTEFDEIIELRDINRAPTLSTPEFST